MASVGGFFRGTSATSDFRFTDSEKKLLKTMTFPENFNEKLDISKVNLDIMKTWIGKEVTEIMGYEDDVLIDMIYNMLSLEEKIDPKHIQITLTPFLDKNAASFTQHLWNLLLSAQQDVNGIPREFIEQRMDEIGKQEQQQTAIRDKINEALQVAKSEIVEKSKESTAIPVLKKRRYSSRSPSYTRRRSNSRSRRYNRSRRYSRSRSYSPSYDSSSEKNRSNSSSPSPARKSRKRSVSRSDSDSKNYHRHHKTCRSRSYDRHERHQQHRRHHHSSPSSSEGRSNNNSNKEESS